MLLDSLKARLPGAVGDLPIESAGLVELADLLEVLGAGPVYALAPGSYNFTPNLGIKVPWFASPDYSGPVRIRGGKLDGRGALLINAADSHWRGQPVQTISGENPYYGEVDLLESTSDTLPSSKPWRFWPSGTYVPTSGCYAWQVDGLTFTELIVVRL